MADDLAASLAFAPEERLVVGAASVVVHPPRTWPDLIRRRIRAAVSTAQVEGHMRPAAAPAQAPAAVLGAAPATTSPQASTAAPTSASARTSKADLTAVLRREPRLFVGVVVFVAAAVVARRKAEKAIRAQDFGTWLRDESSRQN
jgi:hypothetical protein